MESSSLLKVAAAFLVGVVVALGSALIYVRINEVPEKSFNVALPTNTVPSAPEAKPTLEPEPPPAPKPSVPVVAEAKPLPKAKAAIRPKPAHPVKEQKKESVTVIAHSYPAPAKSPLPAPVETPRPAVNEPAPLSPTLPNPAPVVEASAPVPAPVVRQPHVITLQPGTNLSVRLNETLSSDHNYGGDTFRATLEAPIIVDGFIIAERGSKVLGKVTNAQKAGRVEGLSDLTLALTEINTTDGQRVRIQTEFYDKKGSASTGSDAAKIAGGAALGAIIGAMAGGGKGAAIGAGAGGAAGTGIVLATRGKPAALPVETRLTFRLSAPATITEQFNN